MTISFPTKDGRNIGYPYASKKVNTDPDFTYFTKINSKLIIDEWLWGNPCKWEVGVAEEIYQLLIVDQQIADQQIYTVNIGHYSFLKTHKTF